MTLSACFCACGTQAGSEDRAKHTEQKKATLFLDTDKDFFLFFLNFFPPLAVIQAVVGPSGEAKTNNLQNAAVPLHTKAADVNSGQEVCGYCAKVSI